MILIRLLRRLPPSVFRIDFNVTISRGILSIRILDVREIFRALQQHLASILAFSVSRTDETECLPRGVALYRGVTKSVSRCVTQTIHFSWYFQNKKI